MFCLKVSKKYGHATLGYTFYASLLKKTNACNLRINVDVDVRVFVRRITFWSKSCFSQNYGAKLSLNTVQDPANTKMRICICDPYSLQIKQS